MIGRFSIRIQRTILDKALLLADGIVQKTQLELKILDARCPQVDLVDFSFPAGLAHLVDSLQIFL